jgi:hypothetical protein
MKNLALFTLLLLLLGVVTPQTAHAEPSPAAKGIIVGSIGIGSSAVGALGLGALGVGVGATTCGNQFECWGPLLYGGIGATIGGAVGMPLGAALSAKKFGARPGKLLLNMGITAGASLGVLVIGEAVWSPALSGIGLTGLGLGLPITAAVTVAHQLSKTETSASLTISPMLQRGRQGVIASMRF